MRIKKVKLSLWVFIIMLAFGITFCALAEDQASSDKNIFQDSDQDGLSNDEEKLYGTDQNNPDTDGDGYSDGTEVKSGYDPTRPAPGDKIVVKKETAEETKTVEKTNTETTNLTENLSTQVASLIQDKQAKNETISINDLDSIIQETTSSSLTFDDLPVIDESTIKIKKQNYAKLSKEDRLAKEKEDSLQYLTAVTYIFANNSPEKITEMKDLENLSEELIGRVSSLSTSVSDVSSFDDIANKGELALEQLKEIEVPENLLDVHKKGMQLGNYAISLKAKYQTISNDPVSQIVELSKAASLINLSIEFSDEISSRLEELGISEIPFN